MVKTHGSDGQSSNRGRKWGGRRIHLEMRLSELWRRQVVQSSASSRTSGVLLPVRGQQQHEGRTSSKQSRRVVPVRWRCQPEESTVIIFFLVHFFLPCDLGKEATAKAQNRGERKYEAAATNVIIISTETSNGRALKERSRKKKIGGGLTFTSLLTARSKEATAIGGVARK
ncbi:hypothetical protein Dimus_003583 [Dionaea muscipula]